MSRMSIPCRFYGLLVVALLLAVGCGPKKTAVPSTGSGRPSEPVPAATGPTKQPTVQIKADPSTLRPGDAFSLSWNSTDAERLTIDNGIGTVAASGSMQLSVTQSTTYTATATNRLGSATASTRVSVTAAQEPPAPVVTRTEVEGDDIVFRNQIKDVFFDYDRFELTGSSQEILKRDADALRKIPNARFTIEGHCDERGTSEYNLALGDRRAQSVKNFLVSLGVNASRIETISYGKERPFADGHDESAWSQNRRAHFALRR